MTRAELALLLDHSVLKPEATERDIRSGADIVRNWRIGCELAGDRDFVLVSLSPKPLAADASTLQEVIRETARRSFLTRTWLEVLDGAPEETCAYATDRKAIR